MTPPSNNDGVYLLGLWWLQFSNKACITIAVFRVTENSWIMIDNWTERNGARFFREATELVGPAHRVTTYVEKRMDGYVANGNVLKHCHVAVESDAEDIYRRVFDVFVGLGRGTPISSSAGPPTSGGET